MILTALLIASASVVAHCPWEAPRGAAKFTGSVPGAVDHYQDIPVATRAKLKARMERRQYDEIVDIRKDAIVGARKYAPSIREMHFGSNGKVCTTVDRSMWTPSDMERGLVYCEDNTCILVPTVCSNVSRIDRLPEEPQSPATPPTATAVPPAPTVPVAPPETGLQPPTAVPGTPPIYAHPPTTFDEGTKPPLGVPPNYWAPPHWFDEPPPPWLPPVFIITRPPQIPPPLTPVPEPSTWALMILAAISFAVKRRYF
jgi:hypothetical protein